MVRSFFFFAGYLLLGYHVAIGICLGSEQIWTGSSGTGLWSDGGNWEGGNPPAGQASTLLFRSGGGELQNDLEGVSVTGIRIETGFSPSCLTGNPLLFSGAFVNQSDVWQRFWIPLAVSGNFSPELGGGLSFSSLSVEGDFIPVGEGGVALEGSNSFTGNLDLSRHWKVSAPLFKGNYVGERQNIYHLQGNGVNRFLGLSPAGRSQQGDAVILEGTNTFTGNLLPIANDSFLVITNGTASAESLDWNSSRGWNSSLFISPGGVLTAKRLRNTSGKGIFLKIEGTLNITEWMDISSFSHWVATPSPGTVNAEKLGLSTFYDHFEVCDVVLNVGQGGLHLSSTPFRGATIGALNGDLSISGRMILSEGEHPTVFRASLPSDPSIPADIALDAVLEGKGNLSKVGPGILTLGGDIRACSGRFSVLEGTLFLDGLDGENGASPFSLYAAPGAVVGRRVPGCQSVGICELSGGSLRLGKLSAFSVDRLVAGDCPSLCFEVTPYACGRVIARELVCSSPSKIRISLEGTALPAAGTFTLLEGAGLDPLTGASLFELESEGGTLFITPEGNLCVRTAGTISPLSPLTWNFYGNAAEWDLVQRNWKQGETGNLPFVQQSPLLFPDTLAGSLRLTVAEGISPGPLANLSSGTLILAGKKLMGNAPVLFGGPGTTVIDGEGFDSQPITVTNGILKLGENAGITALGTPYLPLKVAGTGTFDLNYTRENPDDQARARITHDKEFVIEGEGFGGQGALMNSGLDTLISLNKITLSGSATFSTAGRYDMRPATLPGGARPGRTSLKGPGEAILTLLGDGTGIGKFCVINGDISLGGLLICNQGALLVQEDTVLSLPLGITLKDGGILRTYDFRYPLEIPINVRGSGGKLLSERNSFKIRAPITIDGGAVLQLAEGSISLAGKVLGAGTLQVLDGEHFLVSDYDRESMTVDGGIFSVGDMWNGGKGMAFPQTWQVNSGARLRFAPGESMLYTNLAITGEGSLVLGQTRKDSNFTLVYSNCTVNLPSGSIELGWKDSFTRVILERGTALTTSQFGICESRPSNPLSSLEIREGASLTLLPGRGFFRIGHWVSDKLQSLTLNGGTIDSALPIRLGWHSLHTLFTLNAGTVTAPGLGLRWCSDYRKESGNSEISEEVFAMNGGTLNLGENGFDTTRPDPRFPQAFLNGGTLNATADFGTKRGQNLTFDRYLAPPDGTFFVNTAGHRISWRSALQGRSKVVVTGDGPFVARDDLMGGVEGHWTVESGDGTALENGAAFSGGLALAENRHVSVKILPPERYVSMYCYHEGHDGNIAATFCDKSLPYGAFSGRMHDLLMRGDISSNSAYLFTGEFYVEEEGDYTFAGVYDDTVKLTVDSEVLLSTPSWNTVGVKTCHLTAGWHPFKLVVRNNGKPGGPNGPWKNAGKVVGWTRVRTDSTSPDAYTRFDTDTLRMRPAPSVWHARYGGVSSERLDRWASQETFETCRLLPSLQPMHSPSWDQAEAAINEFRGWFKVEEEEAGTWEFSGRYDDRILVEIDGQELFRTPEWNVGGSGSISLRAGLHAFRIRIADRSAPFAAGGNPVLTCRVNGAAALPFDERAFRITSAPYGFIGGDLHLAAGSELQNVADSGALITGTLSGTGTLRGKYRLDGAVWEMCCGAAQVRPDCLAFVEPDENTLERLGKIRVAFDGKPIRSVYTVGPALGLNASPEELAQMLEVTVPGEGGESLPYDGLVLDLENGNIVMRNIRPLGTLVIVR